jgi:hypothetical protein
MDFSYWHKIDMGEQVQAVMMWVGPEGADFMMIRHMGTVILRIKSSTTQSVSICFTTKPV